MAFRDTLEAMMTKHDMDKKTVAKTMAVSEAQVYRYLSGTSQPKWDSVLLLLNGLDYELKISKKKPE